MLPKSLPKFVFSRPRFTYDGSSCNHFTGTHSRTGDALPEEIGEWTAARGFVMYMHNGLVLALVLLIPYRYLEGIARPQGNFTTFGGHLEAFCGMFQYFVS